MSTCSPRTMTNNHELGLFAQISEKLQTWGERRRQRRELSHWTDRDLHDVGLSWSDIVEEAEKAVLAGLNAAGLAPPLEGDANHRLLVTTGSQQ